MSTTTTQNEKLPSSSQSAGSTTPQHVLAVDATGAAISFGGGGATIGAAVPATATAIAVKDNSGNLAYPVVDGSGHLVVSVTGAGSGGTSSVDGDAYTAGTTAGTALMIARDDSSPTALAEDKVGIARGTSARAVHVNLRKSDGTELAVSGAPLIVDGSAVTQPVSLASVPSHAVTNAGTFAVQNTQQGTASQNVAQLAGTTTDVNSGNKSAGTLRVVIATDQPALTNKLLVTPDLPSGASTAAKQPALGTAGTASSNVITVQGIASMTPIYTSGLADDLQTIQSGVTANGNGSLLDMGGYNAVVLTITGIPGGGTTVNFEGTNDVTNYTALVGYTLGTSAPTFASSTATAGTAFWVIPTGGLPFFRARVSAYSTGTITVVASRFGLNVSTPTTQPVSGTLSITANSAVNVAQVAGTTTDTNSGNKSAGTIRVVLATDQPALTNKLLVTPDSVALPSNQSVNISQINGVTPLMGAGNTGTGSLRVTLATDQTQLTNALKVDPSAVTSPVSIAGVVGVKVLPQTSGGFTTFHLESAGSTNATNIKASAGQVFGWYIYNSNAAARKVAFHNTAGTPTAGASIYFTLVIPPTSAANVFNETGIPFSTGVAITTVTGLADSNSTGVAADDLNINIWYA